MAAFAQESVQSAEQDDWGDLLSRDMTPYNWCKKEAFDYGAIGSYRHLFVLACLNRDVTAAIDASN